ncbi:MAG: MarR family winged helix-turn-helix transcriptional regulator [Microthrixaceae bacterium]
MTDTTGSFEDFLDGAIGAGAPGSPEVVTGIVVWLSRLARAHESVVARLNEQHGLLRSETGVLITLWLVGVDGGLRPSLLAAAMEQTTGGMTATLKRLEGAGLIERVADPADGRVLLARLTDKGREIGLESFGDMALWYDEALSDADQQTRQQMLTSVKALFGAVERKRFSDRT